MATPHVTGVMALMLSAENPEPQTLKDTVEETATKPYPTDVSAAVVADAGDISEEQVDNLFDDDVRDARYGYGIIDAYAAVTALDEDAGEVTGQLVDNDSESTITEDARVTIDDVDRHFAYSAANDEFTFEVMPGTYTVSATDMFGYESGEATVEVTETEEVTQNIELDAVLDAEVGGQPAEIEADDGFVVSGQVAHLENYTVELGENADIGAENISLELSIDGQTETVELGETVELDEATSDDFELSVDLDGEVDDVVALDHTFEGLDDDIETSSGQTELVDEIEEVPPLEFSETEIVDEALVTDPVAPGSLTIHNPADQAQIANIVWSTPLGDLPYAPIEVGPGEEETLEPALTSPASWYGFGGPGDTIEYSFILSDGNFNQVDEANFATELTAGSLSGEVTDGSGDALGGITVTATNEVATFETTTNSDGEYHLEPDLPGEWKVTAESDSYGPTQETVTIDEDLTAETQDFELGSSPTFDFEMEADETYSLGLPADVEGGTVGDVLDSEAAQVWAFDAEADEWESVGLDHEVGALDALVVSTNAPTEATVTFAGTPGEDDTAVPGSTDVEEGWNFVAPSEFNTPEDAFVSTQDTLRVMQIHEQADSPMMTDGGFSGVDTLDSTDTVNPFSGYFVGVDDDGEMLAATHDGLTLTQAYENLNVDASGIDGQVTSDVTGEPIEGVEVSVEGSSHGAVTDDEGSYTIPAVPDDIDQSLTFDAEGYEGATVDPASGTEDVSLQDEVYYNVTDFSVETGTEYELGDPIEVQYTVENEGSQAAQQIVSTEFGMNSGEARMNESTWQLNSTMLELDADETKTITVEGTVEDFVTHEPSEVGVFTDDDEATEGITVLKPEEFSVTDLDFPEEGVETDDEIDITAEIENTGDLEDTQDVVLEVDGEEAATEEGLTLAGGATDSVTFGAVTIDEEPGDYDVTVSTDDDSATETLTVLEPLNYHLSNLDFPAEAVEDEAFDVTISVENTGEVDDEGAVDLEIEDEENVVVESQSATLEVNASEQKDVTFEDVSVGTAGDYNVTVSTPDDEVSGDLTVQEQPVVDTVDASADPATVPAGGDEISTITATVTDQFGETMDGEEVSFTVQSGDGTLSETSATAGENGEAETTYTTAEGDDDSTVTILVEAGDQSTEVDITVEA